MLTKLTIWECVLICVVQMKLWSESDIQYQHWRKHWKHSAVFSKLNLQWGFHQVKQHQESRVLTTFWTHKALLNKQMLNFRLVITTGSVYQCSSRNPQSKKHFWWYPTIVFGLDQDSHDRNLELTLAHLESKGNLHCTCWRQGMAHRHVYLPTQLLWTPHAITAALLACWHLGLEIRTKISQLETQMSDAVSAAPLCKG